MKIKDKYWYMCGDNNPAKRPEVRKKISKYHKGRPKSKEHKKKLSDFRGDRTWEEISGVEKAKEMREHLSKVSHFNIFNKNRIGKSYEEQFGVEKAKEMKLKASIKFSKPMGDEHKRKIGRGNLGKKHPNMIKRNKSLINRNKVRLAHQENWKDREYALEHIKGFKLRPTRPEKIVNQICVFNKLPFNYVGDGKVWLNGKNPDFLSKNPKHIIEVNGDYWHNLEKSIEKDKSKRKAYRMLGYKTLTIWEHSIYQNPQRVTEKIINFINK